MTEGSQEFCLRWNNHQATIISVFDYLLENETLVDCTLAAEGQYLKAHKVVLCACSPYLELLLSQHNDKHPILIFKDIKFNELKSMIDYMYKGEVNIAQDQLNHFLKAAESLQIKGLSESEEESTTQTAAPAPRPPPPRAPPVQRTQPRPISNAVAVRSSDVVDLPESPKRINRNDAASPSRKRRRQVVPVQGRPSLSGDDASNASEGHLDQSNCDVPSNTSLQSSENAVAKVETNSELMLEPKTEYDDNSVEDITLDDDEEDYSQAGTSQMDNSQMNFSGWQQMVGDKSTDDVFAGQDTGAQNSQDVSTGSKKIRKHNCINCRLKMNHDITSFIKHVNCCMNSKNNAIKKCIVCVNFRGSFDDVIRHIMNDHYGGTTDIVKVEDAGVDETSAKKQSKRQTVSVTATMINQAEEQTEVVLSSTEETSEKIVKRKKANKQKAKKIVKRKKADKRKAPETPKSGKSVEETEAVDDGEKKVKTKKAKKKLKGTKKLKAKNKNARKKQLKKGISQDILPDATGISPIDFNEIKEMPVAKKQKHIECVVIEGSESYGELARKECKKERTDTNIGVEENNQIDNNITFNARTLKESKKFESRLTTTTLHEIRTFTSDVSESNISVISIKSATKKGEKKYFQYADDEIGHEAKALGATKNDRLAVVQSDRNNDETNQIGRHNFDDHKHKKHVQDTSLHSKINEINQENQMEKTKFHNQTRRIDSKFREIDLQKSPYQNHQSPSVNHLREDYRPHNRRRNVYDEIVHGPPSYGRRSNNTSNRFGRDDFGDFNRNPSVKGNFPPSFQNEPSRRFSNPFLPTTEGQSFNPAVPNRGYVYPGLYARAPPGVRENKN